MSLPTITFNIAKDGLGRLGLGVQKVPGLVISGASVVDKITIGNSHQIFSLKDAEDLGIEATGVNKFAHKHLTDFFTEAGQGAEIWIMLVSDATTYEDMADVNENLAKKLIADSAGKVRILGLVKESLGTATVTEGVDADSHLGVIKAQALAEYYSDLYRPFRVVISGNDFSGILADLKDYEEAGYNRVNMLIANNDGAAEASVGLSLGRLAKTPTQRKQNRVKDGNIIPGQAYFTDGSPVETLLDAWDAIDDKRYTFFRNFAGRAGFYFTNDHMLTTSTEDFSSLARGLVMDEAVIIAYDVLIEELSDEIPMTEAGLVHPAIVKYWQNNIENRLQGLMVNEGKLSNVKAYIDENQNVLETDTIEVSISLQPVGYADFIVVQIGFTTKIEN